jgi:hypothetical protein
VTVVVGGEFTILGDGFVRERITKTIVNSIADLFTEPEFDNDGGDVRILARDDDCVWLGLFPTDENGERVGDKPTVTWTIEVSREKTGNRQ